MAIEDSDDLPEEIPDLEGLTPKEKNAIRTLERLAKRWPKRLWIFAADGRLRVMVCRESGERAYTPSDKGDGGVDPDHTVAVIDIPSDGGDW